MCEFAPMLKALIDEDDFCRRLRTAENEDPGASFYACFGRLLRHPSADNLEALLSSYAVQDTVNGLKHLIKFKLHRMTSEAVAHVVEAVEMLLAYEKGLDTLVVNLLRHHMVREVHSMYVRNSRYFAENPGCMAFLAFFCAQDASLRSAFDTHIVSRDFLFSHIRSLWSEHGESADTLPVDTRYLRALHTSTPLNILSAQISVELEMNIAFLLENEQNFDFHMSLLFRDHMASEGGACRVLRYLVNIPRHVRIARLVNAVLERYPSVFLAVVYDILFWNQTDELNANLVEYLREEESRVAGDRWRQLRAALQSMEQKEQTLEHVVRAIHGMNFSRYYGMIRDMGRWKTPIVPREMYRTIIPESFGWDGYAQVYLWKVLAFQKIHLGYEVCAFEEGSPEALEGLEIMNAIRSDEYLPGINTFN